MKKAIILRGISGCGKTTWTKTNAPDAVVVSADHFFIQEDGSYVYDRSKLSEAHEQAFRAFILAAQDNAPFLIVDNTNITTWEISPYLLAARAYGYSVEILTLKCSVETALVRQKRLEPDHLRVTAENLEKEERRFPESWRRLHRVISTDA